MAATPYTGLARPPIAQDNPQMPMPGVAPQVNIPADTDGNNVATLLLQQYRALADFVAYIQASQKLFPPIVPALGSGFSTVVRVGTGAGVIVPTGPCNTGLNCVVKIMAGGATGVATFQFSTDGGITYGATTTTATSYTDVGSGVILAFSGTFVTNDTYQWYSAMTPIARFCDPSGNVRGVIDHNGILSPARYSMMREDWLDATDQSFSTASSALVQSGRWQVNGSASYIEYGWTCEPSTTADIIYIGRAAKIGCVAGAGLKGYLQRSGKDCIISANLVLTLEFAALMPNVQSGTECYLGLFDTTHYTDMENSAVRCWFTKKTTSTVWSVQNNPAGLDLDTAVSIDHTQYQRFRIEIHGANTPIGIANGGVPVSIFFINESLVALSAVGLVNTQQFAIGFGMHSTGSPASTPLVYVGAVTCISGQYLSLPSL